MIKHVYMTCALGPEGGLLFGTKTWPSSIEFRLHARRVTLAKLLVGCVLPVRVFLFVARCWQIYPSATDFDWYIVFSVISFFCLCFGLAVVVSVSTDPQCSRHCTSIVLIAMSIGRCIKQSLSPNTATAIWALLIAVCVQIITLGQVAIAVLVFAVLSVAISINRDAVVYAPFQTQTLHLLVAALPLILYIFSTRATVRLAETSVHDPTFSLHDALSSSACDADLSELALHELPESSTETGDTTGAAVAVTILTESCLQTQGHLSDPVGVLDTVPHNPIEVEAGDHHSWDGTEYKVADVEIKRQRLLRWCSTGRTWGSSHLELATDDFRSFLVDLLEQTRQQSPINLMYPPRHANSAEQEILPIGVAWDQIIMSVESLVDLLSPQGLSELWITVWALSNFLRPWLGPDVLLTSPIPFATTEEGDFSSRTGSTCTAGSFGTSSTSQTLPCVLVVQ